VIAWIGLALFVAVLIVEIVVSMRRNPAYFTFGLPIFMRRVETLAPLDALPLDELARSTKTAAADGLRFRRLTPRAIAFREGFGQYVPIMRGLIRARDGEAAVAVIGFVNWSVLAALLILAILLGKLIKVVAFYLLLALAILYLIQSVRYFRMASAIRRLTGGR
jgi:hypothetical protein